MKASFWKNIIRFIEAQRLFLLLGAMLVVLAVGSGFWQTAAWSAEEAVDQVHASWEMDSATTLTIAWHTQAATAPSSLQYRQAGSAAWETTAGSATTAHDGGLLHNVTLDGLSSGTSYEYRLADGAGGWSQVFESATAPPAGSTGAAGFNVVYVADTGLQGRADGLASGTEAVLTAVQSLQPLALLGGGDYAYYNTDTRYATLEEAIDAWFVQMQPLAAAAPLMPVYGNHELNDADDADGYDEWAARFFTPAGQNKQYSFDIGSAHFISIYAPVGVLDDQDLAWIEADIRAAQAAGQKWIIPYFHVAPFSDGSNHSSSFTLRDELGPMFERLGVRLALSSHDQSYERTYPLVDVPAANSPTTADRSCYQPGEGVVWLKASPGGKLSNVNWDFSQFLTLPPPAHTAVRTNQLHHFVELEFASDDSLWVKAWGVPERGGTPLVVDEFRLSPAGCDPELRFDLPVLEKRLDFDSPPSTVRVQLSTGAGAFPAGINIQSSAGWLTTAAVGAGQYVLALDPSGLAPGTYTAKVIATAAGYAPARLPVVLVVRGDTGAYSLQVSLTPDRSNPIALHGQTVAGDVYIFTTPDTPEIGQVRFFIDHQDYHRENSGPYDLVGSSGALALPYDSTLLSDGWHNVTAAVVAADGSTQLASASFRIDNFPGPDIVAPQDVTIAGPISLDLSTSYTFTATVSPISSTLPLTYTWTVSGQNPETHTGASLTDVFGAAFDAPGEQQVNVTVANAAGLVFDAHPVTVNGLPGSTAPQIVQVDGPLSGAVAAAYTFTATVAPVTATLPLTYTWTVAGLAPVVHLAGQSDSVSFSWDSPGAKEVSVTAANAFGLVSGKYVIQIADLPQYQIALPLMIKSGP